MIILSSLFGLRVIFVRLDKNERLVYNDSNKPSAREAHRKEKNMLYLAYGSNLSISQMTYRCPDAELVGRGFLKDWKLVFHYHADIERAKGEAVPFVVWNISKEDEKRLDRYEGVKGGYYRKITVRVRFAPFTEGEKKQLKIGGKLHGIREEAVEREATAMVYIMTTENASQGLCRPSEEYLETIEEGYERFGFDRGILESAVNGCSEYLDNI